MQLKPLFLSLILVAVHTMSHAVVFVPFVWKGGKTVDQEPSKQPSAVYKKPHFWLERTKLRENAQQVARRLGSSLINICNEENRHILQAQRRSCYTLQDVHLSSGDYVIRANFSFDDRNELVRIIAFFPPQRNGILTEADCLAANEQVKGDINRAYPDAKVFKAARADASFAQIESQAWLVENEGSFEVELFTKAKRDNLPACQVRISRST